MFPLKNTKYNERLQHQDIYCFLCCYFYKIENKEKNYKAAHT